jgi:hypothetical protein
MKLQGPPLESKKGALNRLTGLCRFFDKLGRLNAFGASQSLKTLVELLESIYV